MKILLQNKAVMMVAPAPMPAHPPLSAPPDKLQKGRVPMKNNKSNDLSFLKTIINVTCWPVFSTKRPVGK